MLIMTKTTKAQRPLRNAKVKYNILRVALRPLSLRGFGCLIITLYITAQWADTWVSPYVSSE